VSEVNWSALKKQANDATRPAPVGEHVVEIKKCSWKLNSSGNPMYSVQANVVEGPAEGKTIFNNFNLTTENSFAMAIFFRHMEALGLGDAFFAAGPSHDQVCRDRTGTTSPTSSRCPARRRRRPRWWVFTSSRRFPHRAAAA
jgi:hypothetical protein